jgi:hypothetical protein
MAAKFPLLTPHEFFDHFVLRSYREHVAAPLDPYCAKMAAYNADVMAERVWDFCKNSDPARVGGARSAARYRRSLVAECADFQLVWDVNDSHKHVHLDRRSDRKISSAEQAGVRSNARPFGSGAFGTGPFGAGASEFVIVLDDGTERPLSQVLANVVQMWERVLSRFGPVDVADKARGAIAEEA